MANIKIIMADTDEKYLMPLERKFIDGLDDKVDLIVITDPNYLKIFFSTPQKIDILIINEELYDTELERHNIANIFILKEEETCVNNIGDLDTNQIYKYTSVKEIYNEIINKSSTKSVPLNNIEETKVLMLYSPIGGIGKTSISVALCEAIAKYHKKVLFIGNDNLQTYGSVIEHMPDMESGVEKLMVEKSEYIYEVMKSKIIQRTFDILPPFHFSLPSLNVKGEDYINLLNCIKKTKDYDYIIVDGASDFTEDISRFMGYANHTIIIAGQDKNATHKLDCLLRNIDCSDTERFVFVCNKYRSNRENLLESDHFINQCGISEYIDYCPDNMDWDISYLLNNRSIQKLALMFI
jgi:cellulose biosynthesis protein BcsQ